MPHLLPASVSRRSPAVAGEGMLLRSWAPGRRSWALEPARRSHAERGAERAPSPAPPAGSPPRLHTKPKRRISANYAVERNAGSFAPGLGFSAFTPPPSPPLYSDLISLLFSHFPWRFSLSGSPLSGQPASRLAVVGNQSVEDSCSGFSLFPFLGHLFSFQCYRYLWAHTDTDTDKEKALAT